ncbi:MAG: hypothetical protein ACYC35_22310 [Pirellulales bacterium]
MYPVQTPTKHYQDAPYNPPPDPPRLKEDIERVCAAADKMARLHDELLRTSRVGRVVNPPARVTFQDLVQDALDAMAGQITQRAVTIERRLDQQPVTLYGDRMRL